MSTTLRSFKPGAAAQPGSMIAKAIGPQMKTPTIVQETDEQIRAKLTSRFTALDNLVTASIRGDVRSIIVSGPPGLGKTYNIEKQLSDWNPEEDRYEIISGYTRATGLYKTLYRFRDRNRVAIFDDCDSVFYDEGGINILKKAVDTSPRRVLSWHAETKMEDDEGNLMPTSFEFNGTVIFITNVDFDRELRSNAKISEHLAALVDRSFYLDMQMKTKRDFFIRICQVVEEGMLRNMGLSVGQEKDVLGFVEDNLGEFRQLSIRAARKVGLLVKTDPDWMNTAKFTLLRQG